MLATAIMDMMDQLVGLNTMHSNKNTSKHDDTYLRQA
jgi:hypothetical protein